MNFQYCGLLQRRTGFKIIPMLHSCFRRILKQKCNSYRIHEKDEEFKDIHCQNIGIHYHEIANFSKCTNSYFILIAIAIYSKRLATVLLMQSRMLFPLYCYTGQKSFPFHEILLWNKYIEMIVIALLMSYQVCHIP